MGENKRRAPTVAGRYSFGIVFADNSQDGDVPEDADKPKAQNMVASCMAHVVDA